MTKKNLIASIMETCRSQLEREVEGIKGPPHKCLRKLNRIICQGQGVRAGWGGTAEQLRLVQFGRSAGWLL